VVSPPPPATAWLSSGEHDEHSGESRQETGVQRLAEPAHGGSKFGHMDPELSDEFRSGRIARIHEIVVVSFEVVMAVLDQDDAMQHRLAQDRAVVQDDIADAVGAPGSNDGQIVLVKEGLHAHARGHCIRR